MLLGLKLSALDWSSLLRIDPAIDAIDEKIKLVAWIGEVDGFG